MKINLDTPILNIKGEKMKNQQGITQTLRDLLLAILNSKFDLEDRAREPCWTIELGILFASSKNKIIDIDSEKFKFLKRVVLNNKVKQLTPPLGEKEIDFFFPFELAQLQKIFAGEK